MDELFVFHLSLQEVQFILKALGQLPHDQVRGLVDKLIAQGNVQLEERQKKDGDETDIQS